MNDNIMLEESKRGDSSIVSDPKDADSSLASLQGPSLFAETHTVFASLQAICKDIGNDVLPVSQCLHFSRHYRAVLHAHSLSLQQKLAHRNDDIQLRDGIAVAGVAEMVWHLFEILYMDAGNPIAPKIIQWYQWHFNDDELEQAIESDEPMSDTEYWSFIYRLVMRGKMSDAATLLSRHPERGGDSDASDPFNVAILLLESMPTDSSEKFNEWQAQCQALSGSVRSGVSTRSQTDSDSTMHHIHELGALMAGRVIHSNTWLESFIAELLYKVPTIKPQDLRYEASECLSKSNSSLTNVDHVLLSLLDYDLEKSLKLSNNISTWLGSHLSDILYHVGEPVTDLRKQYLLEYSNIVYNSDFDLFEIVLYYLLQCEGRQMAMDIISQYEPDTEEETHLLLYLCEKWHPQLDDSANLVRRKLAQNYLDKGQMGAALNWLLQADDHDQIAEIIEEVVSKAMRDEQHSQLALLTDALIEDYRSPYVQFLHAYMNFHISMRNSDSTDALTWLMALSAKDSGYTAPKRFIPAILTEAMSIIESNKTILTPKSNYSLMECLEDLESSYHSEYSEGVDMNTVKSVREALAKSLGRSLVL